MKKTVHTRAMGFYRVATVVPRVIPGDIKTNVALLVEHVQAANDAGAELLLTPALSLSGCSCGDLFLHEEFLQRIEAGIAQFLVHTKELPLVAVVGAPLRLAGALYHCALVCYQGGVLGVVPQVYPVAQGLYPTARWFRSGAQAEAQEITVYGTAVPFGPHLLFCARRGLQLKIGIEVDSDADAIMPPGLRLALNGANLICNPAATGAGAGVATTRRDQVLASARRGQLAYLHCGAGASESTTDQVFGGQQVIAEGGTVLLATEPLSVANELQLCDLDLEYLNFARRRAGGEGMAYMDYCPAHEIFFDVPPIRAQVTTAASPLLWRPIAPHPFVPQSEHDLQVRCREVFAIQCAGLATRLEQLACTDVVIGVSGGLDSTLALLVAVQVFKEHQLELSGIYALTMPGLGTTELTRQSAHTLCRALGVTLSELDISQLSRQQMADLGHDSQQYDTAFENIQARQRTAFLMSKANMVNGLVIGTGDLSELALGWCTFGADHISMYNVNVGVPKTLIRPLIAWYGGEEECAELSAVLHEICALPISPELLPNVDGQIAQKTEELIGPYELHDFFLYHFLKRGSSRQKLGVLAHQAFAGKYSMAEIRQWLELFLRRFLSQQFKRSCMPDGPRVGSVGLSPRGAWSAPSDFKPSFWL